MSAHRKAPAVHGATHFSIVLGLSGLGEACLVADDLWSHSRIVGIAMLALMVATWLWLLAGYGIRALRSPNAVKKDFEQPVQGAASALIGIANLLVPTDLLVRTAVDLIRRNRKHHKEILFR
jgi:tellurite resistance protein TehA-like permease